MARCVECGESLQPADTICPVCGHDHPSPPAENWNTEAEPDWQDAEFVPLARFQNSAEAGYFAHELTHRHGMAARVTAEENFDAIRGFWATRFVLSVPEEIADTATARLNDLIAESEADEGGETAVSSWRRPAEETALPDETPFENLEEGGVNWVPIVLTLAAGSAVFWGVRELNEADPQEVAAPVQQRAPHLWDELSRFSGPWYQRIEGGLGLRILRFDRQRGVAVIREDRDGDGTFERKMELPRPVSDP